MPELSQTRAAEILKRARDRRVVVLGDVMLDEFIWGDVTRISPEAPVPVVSIQRESTHLGGAANVLANITAIGAAGSVVGVVGHRNRRLRRDASDVAPDEFVEHDIAQHHHATIARAFEDFFGPGSA